MINSRYEVTIYTKANEFTVTIKKDGYILLNKKVNLFKFEIVLIKRVFIE